MIVLINGNQPRCGKDTLADYFTDAGFYHLKLATPIHKVVCEQYNLNQNEMMKVKDEVIPGIGKTYRQLLIEEGNGKKKIYGDDYYANELIKKIVTDYTHDAVVISDLGFEPELVAFYHFHTEVIHVNRTNDPNPAPDSRKDLSHLANYIIYNDSTYEEYKERCEMLVDLVLAKSGSNAQYIIKG